MIEVKQSQESLVLSHCMLEIAKNVMVIDSLEYKLTEADKAFLDKTVKDINDIKENK